MPTPPPARDDGERRLPAGRFGGSLPPRSRDDYNHPMSKPFFKLPLDLPHAGRLADRMQQMLEKTANSEDAQYEELFDLSNRLSGLLFPYFSSDENPPEPDATRVRDEAAALGRQIVDEIERHNVGYDRLGQCVRNFFECLELGEEGVDISLRAGENPNSLQRPY
jgi:hypothetical protein